MEIKCDMVENVSVISVSGELDVYSSTGLTQIFSDQLSEGYSNFVVSLQGLTYSSSAGVHTFLNSARESRYKGGDLRVAAANQQVDKIFRLSKFDRIVKIFPEVDEAVKSYRV